MAKDREDPELRLPETVFSASASTSDTVEMRGGTPSSGSDPDIEQLDHRFVDEGEVGRGSFGSVRKVYDQLLGRTAAMKVFLPHIDPSSDGPLHEARLTGRLDHPNIVPVYDLGIGEDGQGSYLLMKLVEGRTLGEVLRELRSSIDASEYFDVALDLLIKVCDAVAFAHSQGVIHRDLKPTNVMVGAFGQVYVMDWGIAGQRGGALKEIAGTPEYMAPEQARGQGTVDERIDIFALGAMLFWVLTGRPPFTGKGATEILSQAASGQVPDPRTVTEQLLPPGLCRVVARATAAQPSDRFGSVRELVQELRSFRRGGGWLEVAVYEPGAFILEEGQASDAAYVLVEGRCEVTKRIGGEIRTLRELEAGDVFGEAGAFSQSTRTASVRALTRTRVQRVTGSALKRELAGNPAVAAFVRAMAERFVELDQRLSDLLSRE